MNSIARYSIIMDNDEIPVSINLSSEYLFMIWFSYGFETQYIQHSYFFLQLPDDFTFDQVIDMLFKIHYVFEIKFDERLQNMMYFLKNYVYKMCDRNRKPTTKLIELHERLLPFYSSVPTAKWYVYKHILINTNTGIAMFIYI